MRAAFAILTLTLAAPPLQAQSEGALRSYFEGKSVIVKIEMPGAEQGVDVHPGTSRPIDFPKHASRLKQYGTALRRGDEVLVTKLKVKDDLIEFQLAGGGYGTFGDDASSSVSVASTPKTAREKNLENDLKKATDPGDRRHIKEELDDLQQDRAREDSRNQAAAAQAQQVKEANIRQRRLEGGSRFNLRYKTRVPAEALMPAAVMQALAEYVDFSPMQQAATEAQAPPSQPRDDQLRKGLTVDEVDDMLGRPESIAQRNEGSLKVSTSTYSSGDRRIVAEFVEGVLIRYTITSP